MLTHKRYKQLKARRKLLTEAAKICKVNFKHHNKYGHQVKSSMYALELNKFKRELTLINDTLRMHKILWKQHLSSQVKEFKLLKCDLCKVPCGQPHCCTVK